MTCVKELYPTTEALTEGWNSTNTIQAAMIKTITDILDYQVIIDTAIADSPNNIMIRDATPRAWIAVLAVTYISTWNPIVSTKKWI